MVVILTLVQTNFKGDDVPKILFFFLISKDRVDIKQFVSLFMALQPSQVPGRLVSRFLDHTDTQPVVFR